MKFKSLKIEAERWGKNEGKLVATINIGDENADVTLILPDDVGDKILELSKSAIIDAVEKTANDFIFDITTHIPNRLNLTNQ